MLGVCEVILGKYFKISNFLVSALKLNGDYFSACFFTNIFTLRLMRISTTINSYGNTLWYLHVRIHNKSRRNCCVARYGANAICDTAEILNSPCTTTFHTVRQKIRYSAITLS